MFSTYEDFFRWTRISWTNIFLKRILKISPVSRKKNLSRPMVSRHGFLQLFFQVARDFQKKVYNFFLQHGFLIILFPRLRTISWIFKKEKKMKEHTPSNHEQIKHGIKNSKGLSKGSHHEKWIFEEFSQD